MSLLFVSSTAPIGRGPTTATARRRLSAVVTVAALAMALCIAGTAEAVAAPPNPSSTGQPNFGPNVTIFDPSMATSQIQAAVDAVAAQQVDNEMGSQRYALLFKPGTYGTAAAPLKFQVGYYTEVAGLGQNPTDVTINGSVDVFNRCVAADKCFALDSFWRSLSNLTVSFVAGDPKDGCHKAGMFWAASQASPMRRVNITGGTLSLMDFCGPGPQFASGGFIADSRTGDVINGSQQQYLVRDSSIGAWSNAVWNQVFAGVQGAPAQSFPNPTYTTLDRDPASREKPYLYVDSAGRWSVFVPAPRTNYTGTTWQNGPTLGRSVPLSKFYLARPSDSIKTINSQLSRGMNLLFTPGVYDVDRTIAIERPDTVVLGLGMATLTAVNGAVVMTVADVKGVDIAGLMFDAGTKNSPVLLQVGNRKGRPVRGSAADPTALQDVFFRIGGPHIGKATLSLEVNSDNVILDDIWAWRADHGNPGTVGWTVNTAKNGVIVNGNNVTATGLFVEHYQQYNVIWNGNGGKVVFFQNEMPYDPPSQGAWMEAPGVNGWAALKVADSVTTFNGWGMGSYNFFNQGLDIFAANAFEVPKTLPIGSLRDLLTIFLDPVNGKGGTANVINGVGGPSTIANAGVPVTVVEYPAAPDTTPPAVAITDDVPAATATGDVTFTFTFSENVGSSFTADDIVVGGGTKGAFTNVDATHATLVVSPPVNSTGNIDISVAIGTFSDLAGNLNSAAATAQQAFDTATPKTQMVLPVTFDSAAVDYGLIGFGGTEDSALAPDPTNAANTVAKVVRAAGAETFAGTTITAAAGLGFASRIPFTGSDTTMSVRVWSPDANIPVRLKVEDHADNTKSVETETTTTVAGEWETLTFNFANQATGTAALNLTFNYDKATIFFDFGRAPAAAVLKTYYFDDVTFVPGTPPPPPAAVITFDESTPPVLTGFGGAEDSTITADPVTPANKVAKVVKAAGSQVWAGTTVSTLANQAIPRIAFSATNTVVTARVWSPDAGIPVRLKVENASNPAQSVETDATTTVAAGWETLAFNFANQAAGTPALDLATTYNKVSIFFDFGTAGTGKTYYFDDLDLTFGGVTPPPTSWAVTFDDPAKAYALTDFALYGTSSAVVADPAGGTNNVAQMFKYLSKVSEQYGGTTVSTGANFSVDTIPFTATTTKMTLRFYSPAVGVRVRLKVENAGNPGINCETDAFTTVAGAWETLTFDFGDPSTHYIPNGPTTYDLTKPTASLNVASTFDKVSVFPDFGLGNGGYAPMPTDRTYYFDDLAFVS